jgi:ADP-ribosylglycohydrolase
MIQFLAPIASWFTAHAVRLAVVGAISMALGVGIYMKGQQNSAIKCATANSEIIVEEIRRNDEIDEMVDKMRLSDVDRALDEFMRPND